MRMDPEVVWAAAGTRRMVDVDQELGRVLGGPVLMSLYPHRYYALVPVETGQRDEWAIEHWTDARYLGEGSVIGAPLVGRTSPDGSRSYWCVPVEEPGDLCDPEAVARFLTLGRTRLRQEREGR